MTSVFDGTLPWGTFNCDVPTQTMGGCVMTSAFLCRVNINPKLCSSLGFLAVVRVRFPGGR